MKPIFLMEGLVEIVNYNNPDHGLFHVEQLFSNGNTRLERRGQLD